MMDRWGLQGMGSFEQERVVNKELERQRQCSSDAHAVTANVYGESVPEATK